LRGIDSSRTLNKYLTDFGGLMLGSAIARLPRNCFELLKFLEKSIGQDGARALR